MFSTEHLISRFRKLHVLIIEITIFIGVVLSSLRFLLEEARKLFN